MNCSSDLFSYHEESCCSSKKEKTDLKFLLQLCYTEKVVMGIFTIMILTKLTYLEDNGWLWSLIYSLLLFTFSIPILVGPLHKHLDVQQSFRTNTTNEDKFDSPVESEESDNEIETESEKKK